VHLHPNLIQVGEAARISLGGFWKLKWLKLAGVGSMAGCSVRPA